MLAACWREELAPARPAAPRRRLESRRAGAAAGPCSARHASRASAARRRSAGSPSADSRVPAAAPAPARDARPAVARDRPAAASTSAARARDASAAASAASRSTPAAVTRGGAASAPRGRHDRPAEPTGVAAADEEPQADAAERAVRRPWRTCCAGARPATAAAPRTRDKRRKGASADAPRATTVTAHSRTRGFETPQA